MQTKEKLFIGYRNLANYITLLGLIFALLSCYFALTQNMRLCVTALILSAICDLFDGAVAKKLQRTDNEKEFGIQLDTIVDVISFGITPIIIAFCAISSDWYALIIYAFYAICAVIRLAYYNTTVSSDTPVKHYRGLPVTCIAFVLPVILFIHPVAINITILALTGIFFITNVKIPKLRGMWSFIFSAIAIALIALWWII